MQREKISETPSELITSQFLYCPSKGHNKSSGSIHKNYNVPIDSFRKEPGNLKSELFEFCIDCRKKHWDTGMKLINKKRQVYQENGKIYCVSCNREKLVEEMATNLNGSQSVSCIECKKMKIDRDILYKNNYVDIKRESIIKQQVSCQECKYVFFKNPNNDYIPHRLETQEVDGIRYINYNGVFYVAGPFLERYKDLLELRILDFDHLTEQEQRDRGLLFPHEPFVPKKNVVSQIKSESAMRLEILKCQLLCIQCHLNVTISREKENPYKSRSPVQREKAAYLKQIKSNGCEICGYKNVDLPRFFDLDHLNPEEKVECLSKMKLSYEYSMEDVIKECSKCRVLCRNCHRIHSIKQLQEKYSLLQSKAEKIATAN